MKTSMPRTLTTTITLIIACLAAGCVAHHQKATLTIRNLRATATLHRDTITSVGNISIGTPDAPFDASLPFAIRLSSGQVLKAREFSLQTVESVATRRIHPIQDGPWKGPDHTLLGVDGFAFVFAGTNLLHFSAQQIILPDKTLEAEIGPLPGDEFHRIPLTRDQFIRIFGNPDIRDPHFEW